MSTDFLRNYIDLINENSQPAVQLDEGIMDSINGVVAKIKAIPGIQRFVQAAQAKKDELIQAAQQSSNAQDLIKNIQATMGSQPAVAEGWNQEKLVGTFLAGAGGTFLTGAASIFFKAWEAMGKPDLSQMMNDPGRNGQIVLGLVTTLVLIGALSLFAGASQVKQGIQQSRTNPEDDI